MEEFRPDSAKRRPREVSGLLSGVALALFIATLLVWAQYLGKVAEQLH